MIPRLILWAAHRLDVWGWVLQRPGYGWRYRLGRQLERWAYSEIVGWAWKWEHKRGRI